MTNEERIEQLEAQVLELQEYGVDMANQIIRLADMVKRVAFMTAGKTNDA